MTVLTLKADIDRCRSFEGYLVVTVFRLTCGLL